MDVNGFTCMVSVYIKDGHQQCDFEFFWPPRALLLIIILYNGTYSYTTDINAVLQPG
jgi:hypothetical protein